MRCLVSIVSTAETVDTRPFHAISSTSFSLCHQIRSVLCSHVSGCNHARFSRATTGYSETMYGCHFIYMHILMFCMYTYFCDILECFRSYPFGRAPFAQTLRISTEEGVVEVWARSVQCVARGLRSKVIFFRREWIRRFPGCLFKALSCVLFFEILVFLAYVSL